MSDEVLHAVGTILIIIFFTSIAAAVWNVYIERYTHNCYLKVKLRENGYEYQAIQWRQWKGFFNLYIYNSFRDQYEWKSVLLFENSEKIINQLTKGKK